MNRSKTLVLGFWIVSCLSLVGCEAEKQAQLTVVTSTTMISSVVKQVGGKLIHTSALAPGDILPDDFDIKPAHIEAIERADLFLYHGWEDWLAGLPATTGRDVEMTSIDIEGNWMVPEIHLEAIHRIRDLLVSVDPSRQKSYEKQALEYENRVLQAMETVCTELRPYQGTPVICSEPQADLLNWIGLDILGTYPRGEDISVETFQQLIETGRRHQVRLVVYDLQSGPGPAPQIAHEIGAEHMGLAGSPLKDSYIDALLSNARALRAKLPRHPRGQSSKSYIPGVRAQKATFLGPELRSCFLDIHLGLRLASVASRPAEKKGISHCLRPLFARPGRNKQYLEPPRQFPRAQSEREGMLFQRPLSLGSRLASHVPYRLLRPKARFGGLPPGWREASALR